MKAPSYSRGFSLVELLIVIGILVIVTTIGLISYSQFSSQTLLNSLAYDMALSIREAQYFGISVRREPASLSTFDLGYGVYFDIRDPKAYIFFADADRDHRYSGDGSCTDECIERLVLGRDFVITDICVVLASGVTECASDASGILKNATVAFERPDPDAYLSSNVSGTFEEVYITIGSNKGTSREISILPTGQISIRDGGS